jgi:hypothetical protein
MTKEDEVTYYCDECKPSLQKAVTAIGIKQLCALHADEVTWLKSQQKAIKTNTYGKTIPKEEATRVARLVLEGKPDKSYVTAAFFLSKYVLQEQELWGVYVERATENKKEGDEMGNSKNNPSKFDCYSKADPDEPMFILLGRDPMAGAMVRLWAGLQEEKDGSGEKIEEAFACADALDAWCKKLGKVPLSEEEGKDLDGLKEEKIETYSYAISQDIVLGTPCDLVMGRFDNPDIPIIIDRVLTSTPCPNFAILAKLLVGNENLIVDRMTDTYKTIRIFRNLTDDARTISKTKPLIAIGYYTGLVPDGMVIGSRFKFVVQVYGEREK